MYAACREKVKVDYGRKSCWFSSEGDSGIIISMA
jgi:hypothetical protein